MQIGQF